MYIDLKIIYFILATLGCIALIYIIITLSNLNKLIKNSNELVIDNKNNTEHFDDDDTASITCFECLRDTFEDSIVNEFGSLYTVSIMRSLPCWAG